MLIYADFVRFTRQNKATSVNVTTKRSVTHDSEKGTLDIKVAVSPRSILWLAPLRSEMGILLNVLALNCDLSSLV